VGSFTTYRSVVFFLIISLIALLALQCKDDPPPAPQTEDPVDTLRLPARLVGIWRLDSTCDTTGCIPPDSSTDTCYMQLRSEGTYCPHNLESDAGCEIVEIDSQTITGTSFKIGHSHYSDVISLTDSTMKLANWVLEQVYVTEYYHREE